MHGKRSRLLSATLMLLGVSCMAFAAHSVAENDVQASGATPKSAPVPMAAPLLPSAPRDTRTAATRNRRMRVARAPAAVAPAVPRTSPAPAPGIRTVLNQKDITLRQRRIAEEVLRLMPAKCDGTLTSFYVRYDNPKQRGLAGKSSMILSGNVGDDEFRALLTHEYGHVMDLGCLTGTPASGPSAFRDGDEAIYRDDPSVRFYGISWTDAHTKRGDADASDFVSGYAQWDPFEDLAETVAAYVLHRAALKELAATNAVIAAKVAWIERELFPEDPAAAVSEFVWVQKRPWDITKLAYTWTAALRWE